MAESNCITVDPALVLQTDQNKEIKGEISEKGYTVGDIIIVTSGRDSFGILGTGRISNYSNNETIKAKVDGWRQFDMD